MNKEAHQSPCDLAEVFSQLERADALMLRKVQVEVARMRTDKERQERDHCVTARRAKDRFGRGFRLWK